MTKVDYSYYVYLYLKPNGTPFYVGKGKDDRWKYHLNEARKDNTTDKNNLKLNTIRKIRKATLGVKKSTTEKMKKPKSKSPCPHCGKLVDGGNMKKWHGDNCKLKNKDNQNVIDE